MKTNTPLATRNEMTFAGLLYWFRKHHHAAFSR